MKIWKLALIAAIAGLILGVTCSEPPFPGLQQAAVSITRLRMPWWADRMGDCGDIALAKHANAVVSHAESEGTTSTTSAVHRASETNQLRVLERGINKPTDWKSNLESKSRIAGVLVAENSLSVDAKNLNLLNLLQDLSEKCDIEIVGKDALADKLISAKFDCVTVEDGIRQLMRIAGVENYAISYGADSGDQYAVSQIVLLPRDNEVSEDYPLAKAEQEADSGIPNQLHAEILRELRPEVREEILADVQAAIVAEVPAEVQADILAEILAERQE